jgi:hypothetical protein
MSNLDTNTDTDKILEKLKNLKETKDFSLKWSTEEKIQLLKMYHIFCKKEAEIFNLIYGYHEGDSWENIFREYNPHLIQDKITGVEIAIKNLGKPELKYEDRT